MISVRRFVPSCLLAVAALLIVGRTSAQGLRGPTAVTHSPYYHAYQPKAIPGANARIGVLPVRLQHPAAARILAQTRAPELLDSLTRYLSRQPGLLPVALPAGAKSNSLPEVYFGSPDQELPGTLPGYVLNLQNPNPGKGVVQLAGWNGQGKTRQLLLELMVTQKLDYLLVPLVRESQLYFSMKTASAGPFSTGGATATDYYLDSGSGHVQHLTRLENLNATTTVLALAGALINAKGEVVLIGAEGLGDTGSGLQPARLGNNEAYEFTAADYNKLLAPARRADLPGNPPAWQEAANQLTQRLTGRQPYAEASPYLFLLVDSPVQQH
ncbi:hypothetical protein Q5H93_07865 [Hymenobacter sp. ASUV-10]|uniref:Uncharacterized protein n=1 Tax=Hymenobacter aranciens TaxID=3063996 RepID=A0ABT9BA45_9BACT|nr:hypothetical protein [Hymenobacter sp. ASUV-10]MDO7874645.1 hypothetical protein [Hymenobacter sp. ASUV-10]